MKLTNRRILSECNVSIVCVFVCFSLCDMWIDTYLVEFLLAGAILGLHDVRGGRVSGLAFALVEGVLDGARALSGISHDGWNFEVGRWLLGCELWELGCMGERYRGSCVVVSKQNTVGREPLLSGSEVGIDNT